MRDYFRGSVDGTWRWVGGLGGWCWVACSIWSMGLDSIRCSHLIRRSHPSWTMLRVQGMFFSGFRLCGAYFEIPLQPNVLGIRFPLADSWAAECSAQGQTLSLLLVLLFNDCCGTWAVPWLFKLKFCSRLIVLIFFNIHVSHGYQEFSPSPEKNNLSKLCIHVCGEGRTCHCS